MVSLDRDAARIRLVFRPHWVNSWLLRSLARPYTRIDGAEYTCAWNHVTKCDVPAGTHVIETFIRYRGTSAGLGSGRITIAVSPGENIRIEARNGWMNGTPFTPVRVSQRRAWT